MRRGLLGSFATALSAVLSLGPAAAQARPLAPERAPAAWVAYAQDATRAITGWLNGEELPAPRLRAALLGDGSHPAATSPPLVVKVWIARDGRLSKVESAPLASADADQDLRTLLVDRRLPPPPRRLRQPLRLAVQVQAGPPASSVGPGGGPDGGAATIGASP